MFGITALTFLALGAILQCCSAIYLSTLIVTVTRLSQALRRRWHLLAALNRGEGTLFPGFGAKLALASLT